MANTVEFLGMGSVRYGTSITSQTIFFPATAQDGDFLVLQAFADREYPSVPSGWTVQFSTYLANYEHFIIATKVKEAGESNVKITTTSPTGIYGVVSAYKNVKSVAGVTGRWESERLAYSPLINDFSVSQTDTLALILSSFNNANSMTITPPNGFTTLEQKVGTGCRFHISGRQMGSETSLSRAQTSTQTSASAWVVGCFLLMLEPVKNAPPTISLTSPSDNQVLSEGNQFLVEGSVSDIDYGDVITIKYKINNGAERALDSAVSDGSNPIEFSKALKFSGDRLYDCQRRLYFDPPSPV
jgi:Bacterial Ig domain